MYVLIFPCLTTLWRGGWNLNPHYLIPELPLGGWVHHVVGTVLMLVFQVYGYVAAFGVIKDGEEEDGGAFFPVQYLQIYLKDRIRSQRVGLY